MPHHLRQDRTDDADFLPAAPPIPPGATPGKRWRFRRNLVIFIAHRSGMSQRMLADVFDLPRSRISEIIKELQRYEEMFRGD